ncbi:hypothetical protein P692DRAFT_201804159 [Suillus brevipes Sb2]|nr:hypothetical protein P692DRAFT_201804159 [Suillus brevipes Sb2]
MPREVTDQRYLQAYILWMYIYDWKKNQTPTEPASDAVDSEDITLTSLQACLDLVEKNCSRYFDLYKKYRLRWLEENHRAEVLEKYAPNVDGYSPAQMPWDAPSPQCPHVLAYIIYQAMGSDVFNANGSMGTMPERIISQAEFFWARSNAIATITHAVTPAVIPLVAPAVPPATSASTGVGQKLKALLRTAIEGVTYALRAVLHAGSHAAKKFAAIFGWA